MRRCGFWPRVETTGWTGGQYSLFRVVLAGYLAGRFLVSSAGVTDWGVPTIALGVVALVLFALGLLDRIAALALGYATFHFGSDFFDSVPLGAVLLLHLALPSAPYGSWPSRKRNDPGGGWRFPAPLSLVIWIGISAWYLGQGFDQAAVVDWGDWGGTRWIPVALGVAALLFGPRPALWGLIALTTTAFVVLDGLPTAGVDFLLLDLVAFHPVWLDRPHAPTAPETVFFDGECGLCHGFVRFTLAEDTGGIRFAPLQGETIRTALSEDQRAELPDSLVVLTDANEVLVRSRGALHVLGRLGGFWTAIALVLRVVPVKLSDAVYDGVARVRKRIFRKPAELCPLVAPILRDRFLP